MMKDQKRKGFELIYTRYLSIGSLVLLLFSSCSDKYHSYKNLYQFKSEDKKPDYSNLNYWAAHPLKWDPSDSIPKPLRKEKRDTFVDVFFFLPGGGSSCAGRVNMKEPVGCPWLSHLICSRCSGRRLMSAIATARRRSGSAS